MTREEALQLLQTMRQDRAAVPNVDQARFSEWFVALRNESGAGRELEITEQRISRRDERIAKLLKRLSSG